MSLSPRFQEALSLAYDLHCRQVRKGSGVPYLAHLMAVASLVLEHGADEEVAIAALLHDAVEDQGGLPTLERIRARFGDRVARVVLGCTDAHTLPKPPWRVRKERYLVHLAQAPPSVLLVSVADKLHNARSILTDYRHLGDALWDRFAGGRQGTLWYYRAVTRTYRTRPGDVPESLVEELDRVVTEVERLVEGGCG